MLGEKYIFLLNSKYKLIVLILINQLKNSTTPEPKPSLPGRFCPEQQVREKKFLIHKWSDFQANESPKNIMFHYNIKRLKSYGRKPEVISRSQEFSAT